MLRERGYPVVGLNGGGEGAATDGRNDIFRPLYLKTFSIGLIKDIALVIRSMEEFI